MAFIPDMFREKAMPRASSLDRSSSLRWSISCRTVSRGPKVSTMSRSEVPKPSASSRWEDAVPRPAA